MGLGFLSAVPFVWSPSFGLGCWVDSLFGSRKGFDTIADQISFAVEWHTGLLFRLLDSYYLAIISPRNVYFFFRLTQQNS